MRVLSSGVVPGGDSGFLFRPMRKLPLFAGLTDVQLFQVLMRTRTLEFDAGEVIFRRGDPGDSFFVVQSGKVEARLPWLLVLSRVVGTMGPGDFFGELALLRRQPRAATARCAVKTVCFSLSAPDLEALMRAQPDIAAAVGAAAGRR